MCGELASCGDNDEAKEHKARRGQSKRGGLSNVKPESTEASRGGACCSSVGLLKPLCSGPHRRAMPAGKSTRAAVHARAPAIRRRRGNAGALPRKQSRSRKNWGKEQSAVRFCARRPPFVEAPATRTNTGRGLTCRAKRPADSAPTSDGPPSAHTLPEGRRERCFGAASAWLASPSGRARPRLCGKLCAQSTIRTYAATAPYI